MWAWHHYRGQRSGKRDLSEHGKKSHSLEEVVVVCTWVFCGNTLISIAVEQGCDVERQGHMKETKRAKNSLVGESEDRTQRKWGKCNGVQMKHGRLALIHHGQGCCRHEGMV